MRICPNPRSLWQAFNEFFNALDNIEEFFNQNLYVLRNRFTESDVRIFFTLIRYDEVYIVYFKCNKKKIFDYFNILNYFREIYQMPEIKETVNMKHINTHYYTCHNDLYYFAIIPNGNDFISEVEKTYDKIDFINWN